MHRDDRNAKMARAYYNAERRCSGKNGVIMQRFLGRPVRFPVSKGDDPDADVKK
jgi:hypothetical protein